MKLTKIVSNGRRGPLTNCASGNCPSLWQDDEGGIYIQGYVVPRAIKQKAAVPAGESLVKIDPALLKNIRALAR